MSANALHTEYLIKCPKSVNPSQINPEGFQDFIPPGVVIEEIRGLTLKQPRRPCRWEILVKLQGGKEEYEDNIKRYDLRHELDMYKPRNTNLLGEKKAIRNGETYWVFEYEIICECGLSQEFLDPST